MTTAIPPQAPAPVAPIYQPPLQPEAKTPVALWIGIIVVALFVIVAIMASMSAKRRRLEKAREGINDNIETGQGGIGNTGIGNAIKDTKPDENYPYAFDDAQKICSAGGYYGSWSQWFWSSLGGTNLEKIKNVFQGKTKAQVAAISGAFNRTTCNQTLDAFLQTQCDEGERRQIYQIIQQAK